MSTNLKDYHYDLPDECIARFPVQKRDESRLLVLNRHSQRIEHKIFREIHDYLQPDDCLVLNRSKVFPARLKCHKSTGGKVEVFLLNLPNEALEGGIKRAEAIAIVHSSKPLKPGAKVMCGDRLEVEFMEIFPDGKVRVALHHAFESVMDAIELCGEVPLPPYIRRQPTEKDKTTYQTVYARESGSVAAPTAGLHFTHELMNQLGEKGIKIVTLTLHVGYGTFAPIKTKDIREHTLHEEWIKLEQEAVDIIRHCKQAGGRVIATGTTTVRALEASCIKTGNAEPFEGLCGLYIMPGYQFRLVDAMITNFHLPDSSLLVLVSAFAGRQFVLNAYRQAINAGYRFYSYGDAMLIL